MCRPAISEIGLVAEMLSRIYMPVLGCYDVVIGWCGILQIGCDAACDGKAVLHRQCPRAKVILHIDDYQCLCHDALLCFVLWRPARQHLTIPYAITPCLIIPPKQKPLRKVGSSPHPHDRRPSRIPLPPASQRSDGTRRHSSHRLSLPIYGQKRYRWPPH